MDFIWSESTDTVNWSMLSELYRLAPLAEKSPGHLQTVFANSRFRCFVFEDDRLVGAGRAMADGLDCSYICDVAVLPSYQKRGLGRAIVSRLIHLSEGHAKIILYAVPGAEGFYASFGFRPMTTAMGLFVNESQAIKQGYLAPVLIGVDSL